MAEIRRSPVEGQVVFPIIYRVSYIPGGAGFQPSTVSMDFSGSGNRWAWDYITPQTEARTISGI